VCVCVCVCYRTRVSTISQEGGRKGERKRLGSFLLWSMKKKGGGGEGETRIFFTLEYDCPEFVGMYVCISARPPNSLVWYVPS